jgi:hypothetical protein
VRDVAFEGQDVADLGADEVGAQHFARVRPGGAVGCEDAWEGDVLVICCIGREVAVLVVWKWPVSLESPLVFQKTRRLQERNPNQHNQSNKKQKKKSPTIPQKRSKSPLPPLRQPPFLMLQRLNDLQIRRLNRHDRLAAQHIMRKSRRPHSLEPLLTAQQHAVFAESRQTGAELVQAEDVVPLRVEGRGEGVFGGFELGAGAVEGEFLGDGVEEVEG